jgi:hypothetical protein
MTLRSLLACATVVVVTGRSANGSVQQKKEKVSNKEKSLRGDSHQWPFHFQAQGTVRRDGPVPLFAAIVSSVAVIEFPAFRDHFLSLVFGKSSEPSRPVADKNSSVEEAKGTASKVAKVDVPKQAAATTSHMENVKETPGKVAKVDAPKQVASTTSQLEETKGTPSKAAKDVAKQPVPATSHVEDAKGSASQVAKAETPKKAVVATPQKEETKGSASQAAKAETPKKAVAVTPQKETTKGQSKKWFVGFVGTALALTAVGIRRRNKKTAVGAADAKIVKLATENSTEVSFDGSNSFQGENLNNSMEAPLSDADTIHEPEEEYRATDVDELDQASVTTPKKEGDHRSPPRATVSPQKKGTLKSPDSHQTGDLRNSPAASPFPNLRPTPRSQQAPSSSQTTSSRPPMAKLNLKNIGASWPPKTTPRAPREEQSAPSPEITEAQRASGFVKKMTSKFDDKGRTGGEEATPRAEPASARSTTSSNDASTVRSNSSYESTTPRRTIGEIAAAHREPEHFEQTVWTSNPDDLGEKIAPPRSAVIHRSNGPFLKHPDEVSSPKRRPVPSPVSSSPPRSSESDDAPEPEPSERTESFSPLSSPPRNFDAAATPRTEGTDQACTPRTDGAEISGISCSEPMSSPRRIEFFRLTSEDEGESSDALRGSRRAGSRRDASFESPFGNRPDWHADVCCIAWSISEDTQQTVTADTMMAFHQELISVAALTGSYQLEKGSFRGVLCFLPGRCAADQNPIEKAMKIGQILLLWAAQQDYYFGLRVGVHRGALQTVQLPGSTGMMGYIGPAVHYAVMLAENGPLNGNVYLLPALKQHSPRTDFYSLSPWDEVLEEVRVFNPMSNDGNSMSRLTVHSLSPREPGTPRESMLTTLSESDRELR